MRSIVRSGNTAYLGGTFDYIGPRTGSLRLYDKTTGQFQENFPAVVKGTVRAISPDGSGGWYVGGDFTDIGGTTIDRLAHITAAGEVDLSFVPAPDDTVTALHLIGADLYLGGSFSNVGGLSRSRIARIGTISGAVDGGWNPGANDTVNVITSDGTKLFVGGNFSTLGGSTRNYVGAFSLAGGGLSAWNPNADAPVYSLLTDAGNVYLGGSFDHVGGAERLGAARVSANDGALHAWNPVITWDISPGYDYPVYSMKLVGSSLYLGGKFYTVDGAGRMNMAAVDKDSGDVVVPFQPWSGSEVHDFDVVDGKIWTVTSLTQDGLNASRFVEMNPADGTFITRARTNFLNSGMPSQIDAIAHDGDKILVSGYFSSIGGLTRKNLAAVDMTNGHATAWSPQAGSDVYALEVGGDGTIFVGGQFQTMNAAARNSLAAVHPGTGATQAFNLPVMNGASSGLVRKLERVGDRLYVGGSFTTINGVGRTHLASVDLNDSSVTAFNPAPNDHVTALNAFGNNLYVGGRFTSIVGSARTQAASFDTTNLALTQFDPVLALSGSPTADVRSFLETDDGVYVGGRFTSAGGQPRTNLARFDVDDADLQSWNPGGSVGRINTMGERGDMIQVGGEESCWVGQCFAFWKEIDPVTGSFPFGISIRGIVNDALIEEDLAIAVGTISEWSYEPRTGMVSLTLPPTSTVTPSITGTFLQGETLTCNPGTWIPSTASFTYTWSSDGNAINGETNPTHVVGAGEVGTVVRCHVTAAAPSGSAASQSAPAGSAPPPSVVDLPQVQGAVAYQQTLTCNPGTWNDQSGAFAYRWQRGGNDIDAATNSTYSLGSADAGRLIRCVVTAAGAGGSAVANSPTVAVPDPSANTTRPSISGTPRAGETLTCSPGVWTNNPTSYSYQWIFTGNGATISNTNTMVVAAQHVNGGVFCRVVATNAGGTATAESNQTSILPAPPINTLLPAVTGTPASGNTVTCTQGNWSGVDWGPNYSWLRDGVPVAGEIASQYKVTNIDIGHALTCRVEMSNAGGVTAATSGSVNGAGPGKAPFVLNNNAASVNGSPRVGQTLTCGDATWGNSPQPGRIYKWLRNGIEFAEGNNHLLSLIDEGQQIRCTVAATNEFGSTTSTSFAVTVSLNPENEIPPHISGGLPAQGGDLTCSEGSWRGDDWIWVNYRWFRNGAVIAGANQALYTAQAGDVGAEISCEAYFDWDGQEYKSRSAPAGSPEPPSPTTNPSLSGMASTMSTLTCNTGIWNGNPQFSFEWYVNGTKIATASANTFAVVQDHLGKRIQCRIIATGAAATSTKRSNSFAINTDGTPPPDPDAGSGGGSSGGVDGGSGTTDAGGTIDGGAGTSDGGTSDSGAGISSTGGTSTSSSTDQAAGEISAEEESDGEDEGEEDPNETATWSYSIVPRPVVSGKKPALQLGRVECPEENEECKIEFTLKGPVKKGVSPKKEKMLMNDSITMSGGQGGDIAGRLSKKALKALGVRRDGKKLKGKAKVRLTIVISDPDSGDSNKIERILVLKFK